MQGSNPKTVGIGSLIDGGAGPPAETAGDGDRQPGPRTETGTTVVGVRAEEAVVLAADRRASLGGRFVSNKSVQKVERVHPRAAMGLSGSVGGVQALARRVRAAVDLYDARRGAPPSMAALSTLSGDAIRGVPAQCLLGGVDDDGTPALYELDGGGAVTPTTYAAAGSGLQVAYGVLEGRAESVETAATAREVADEAVLAASERDTASGDGVTVATVTADGVETTVSGGGS